MITKSIRSLIREARRLGYVKHAYPRGKELKTPGGRRRKRRLDWFVETDHEKIAGDVKIKDKDDDLLTSQELANVMDVAKYCKDVDRIIVVSNGTFPPELVVPKLVFISVKKVLLADLIVISNRLESNLSVPEQQVRSLLRELKII